MYLVYMKIPNKVASFSCDRPVACEYAPLELYINPFQDIDLYNEIAKGQYNGFATIEEAKEWIQPVLEKVFKFIHSTSKVWKTYTKAYVKIVDVTSNIGWRGTVQESFPEYAKPIDDKSTHLTYDMTDFVNSLDPIEKENTKKLYEVTGKKMKKEFPFAKMEFFHDDYHLWEYPYSTDYGKERQLKENAKALDLLPINGTFELVEKLGMKLAYTFYWRVGPYIDVVKCSADTIFRCTGEPTLYGVEYQREWDYCANRKRFNANETTLEDIKKNTGDDNPIDITKWMPFGCQLLETRLKTGEMYRNLRAIGAVPESPDEFKKTKKK